MTDLHVTRKRIPLRAITVSLHEVRQIVERLMEHVEDEGRREIAELRPAPGQNEFEFMQQVEDERKQAFRVAVTVVGKNGQELFGYGPSIFSSASMPIEIETIFISNEAPYKGVAGRRPTNRFHLHLDFSKPRLIDTNNPVSNPTPNNSNLTIEGTRDAWIGAIQNAVLGIIESRSNHRSFLHRAFVYDIGLGLIAFPLSFYLSWRLRNLIEHYTGHANIVQAAAFFYLFVLLLNAYRVLFGYTKRGLSIGRIGRPTGCFYAPSQILVCGDCKLSWRDGT